MHYAMGGIRVDAATGAATLEGLYAAGEVAGGLHGSNRLGGNSLSDLLVFGQRAGAAAAESALADATTPSLAPDFLAESAAMLEAPYQGSGGEDPNRLHERLKDTMQNLVGIFREEADLEAAIAEIEALKARWHGVRVQGPRSFNPAWDLVFELRNMLLVSEAIARSALLRTESRGAHSRLDHAATSGDWDRVNVAVRRNGEVMDVALTPTVEMAEDLRELVAAKG
jgi:succinate dehydrogenase / fumarate reductase flavoprotein subunit